MLDMKPVLHLADKMQEALEANEKVITERQLLQAIAGCQGTILQLMAAIYSEHQDAARKTPAATERQEPRDQE
jgi:hypothetical protein